MADDRLVLDKRRLLKAMQENDADAALDVIVSGIKKHRQRKHQAKPPPDAALPVSREIPKETT